jgi:hypothetical protein
MSGQRSPFPPVPPVGHVLKMREVDKQFVGVFVEGPDDVQLWNRWLKHRPVDQGGCREVRAALQELEQRKIAGCVGIVDADLARLRDQLQVAPNLIVSGTHDHECDLVLSPAFERLLQSLPDAAPQLQALAQPSSFQAALRDRALPFGLLRWLFLDLKRPFPDRLTPNNDQDQFIDKKRWSLNHRALMDVAAAQLGWSSQKASEELTQREARVPDDKQWDVCHGHDVVALLRIALGAVESPSARNILRSEQQVRFALQSALDSSDLAGFPMWQQLVAWEARNPPFLARK